VLEEGFVKINPPESTSDMKAISWEKGTFVMKTAGNDHYYSSQIRLPELITQDAVVLRQPANQNYPFILKLVVNNRIDTGATDYISFKIYKIEKPLYHDFMDEDMANNPLKYFLLKTQIENHANNQEGQETWQHQATRLYYDLKEHQTLIPNPYYVKTFVDKVKELFKPKDISGLFNIKRNQKSYILYKQHGGLFRSYTYKTVNINTTDLDTYTVEPKLINRICVKITIAPEINRQLINTLINYINNENPSLSVDQIYSIIVYCTNSVLDLEGKLTVLNNIGLTKEVNSLKNSEYKLLPNGFVDAFFKEQLWNFIKFKLVTSLGLGINMDNNKDKMQDFH